MVKNILIDSISLIGGTTALNFINTVHDYRSEVISDYFLEPVDLVGWARKVEILDSKEATEMEKFVTANTLIGQKFYSASLKTRGLLYRIFQGFITGVPAADVHIEQFNKIKTGYFKHLKLVRSDTGYREEWDFEKNDLMKILAPVIYDAYELLLNAKPDRIKECPNCGWMFLDSSKNGKRRWCSMQSCGSNIKALDWYYRNKS